MKNRLGYLIEMFHLTGRELADAGHVDVSLVSKWKNGSRKLKCDVESTLLICQYIYNVDKNSEYPVLNTLLRREHSSYDDYSEEKKLSIFAKWLCQPTQSDDFVDFSKNVSPISSYQSSTGLEYRKMQILEVLDTHQVGLFKGTEIFMFNDYGWLGTDGKFLNRLLNRLETLLEEEVCVSLYLVLSYQEEAFKKLIMNLTRLMLYPNFKLSTKIVNSPIINGQFYLINVNERLVHGISNDDNYFTEIITNINSTQMHFNNLAKIYDKNDIKSRTFSVDKLNALIKHVLKSGKRRDNSYFMSQSLFFTSMNEDLLHEILHDNSISEDKITECKTFHKQLNKNFKQNVDNFVNRHIYYYEVLEALAMQESFVCSNLSAIIGEAIVIRKDQYMRHLENTINRLKTHKNYQIAIINKHVIDSFMHDINIWIKDSNVMVLWSEANIEIAASVVDISILDIYTQYYSELWLKVSFVEQSQEMSIIKLNKIIKLCLL